MPYPESHATLVAQQRQLVSGNRRVQMFPGGHGELKRPRGINRLKTKNGDVFHYAPGKITPKQIMDASKAGRENELLDLGPVSKDEAMARAASGERPIAVVERDRNGVETRAAAGTEGTAADQLAFMSENADDGHSVGLENPEFTIAHRADGGSVSPPDGFVVDQPQASSLPAGFSVDQPQNKSPSRIDTLTSAVTDIPNQIYEAGKSAIGSIGEAFNPYSETNTARMEAAKSSGPLDISGGLSSIGNVGRGLLAIPQLVAAPITGAGRSLIGHTFEAATPNFSEADKAALAQAGVRPYTGQEVADLSMSAMASGKAPITAVAKEPGIISRTMQPFTKEGQETLAGRYLLSRAENPDQLEQSLSASAWPRVEGSIPTTFQLTGDMGLGALEREVATKYPAEFMAKRAEQNAARLDAIGGLQETGSPQAVASAVRRQLDDVDQMTQRAVDIALRSAQERAQGATGALEGAEEAARARSASALSEAQSAARGLGGTEAQDVYGSQFRGILRDAEEGARAQESALWRAVDPNNDLTMNMHPIQGAFQNIYGDLSEAARATLKPAEMTVADVISRYSPVEPFRELTDLRSLVSTAMREELVKNGRTPAYSRLSRLRGGIEQSINGAIEDRAVADAANVAAGRLEPENSLAAIIQRQVSDWRNQRGENLASGTGEVVSTRAPILPSAPRTESPFRGQPGDVAGNQGLQANFDQAAAERLRAATAATRERAQTFGVQPLKGVLQREGASGPFRMRESMVPSKIFHPGDTGFDDVQAFRNAVGDAQALPTLRDYAASSLRESALTPDGTIDPSRFQRWRNQHAEALRAFPELEQRFSNAADASRAVNEATAAHSEIRKVSDEFRRSVLTKDGVVDPVKFDAWRKRNEPVLRRFPDFDGQFSTAAKASEAIGDFTALRRKALSDAQEGALGRFIGVSDPQDAVRAVGSVLGGKNSVAEMRRLVGQTRADPAAQEGLRKAIVDYMSQKFISNTEAATTGRQMIKADQFQNFVKTNRDSLRLVFSPQEINMLNAISSDLQRANRSISSVRLPGGSNTAQDLTGLKYGQSKLAQLLIDAAATTTGWLATLNPWAAGASGAAAHVATALRSAGFAKVDDLVKQAMLNPDFARLLLSKASSPVPVASNKVLARRIMAMTAAEMAREDAIDGRKRGLRKVSN